MSHQPLLTKLATIAAASGMLGISACISQEQPAPPQPIPNPTQAVQATATPAANTATPVRTPTASTTTGSPTVTTGTATAGSPTPVRTPGVGTPTSGTPTAGITPVPSGGLIAMANLQQAWTAKGLTVAAGAQSTGFSGFSVQASDVRVTRGSETLVASVQVYPSREALTGDWDTARPATVVPKPNHTLPTFVSVWWSQNVIVVVKERSSSAIGSDALDAFFALTP